MFFWMVIGGTLIIACYFGFLIGRLSGKLSLVGGLFGKLGKIPEAVASALS